jgi:catechol 2,3-dioxygenase-like lactoylglutathione lyase family enzyme
MKRLHVHVSVADLEESTRFYATLFGSDPAVTKDDYAKWMLDDPAVNFAISSRGQGGGLNHLGFQVDDNDDLENIRGRLTQAGNAVADQTDAACCYAKSDKAWVTDPSGIAWETFHTTGEIEVFGDDGVPAPEVACCEPKAEAGCCS